MNGREIAWTSVKSANVSALAYEAENETAYIRFTDGAEYVYTGVERKDFAALKSAPSIGAHLARTFRKLYVGKKVIGERADAEVIAHPVVRVEPTQDAELRRREEAVLRAAVAWEADDNAVCSTPEEQELLGAVISYLAHPSALKPLPKTPTLP